MLRQAVEPSELTTIGGVGMAKAKFKAYTYIGRNKANKSGKSSKIWLVARDGSKVIFAWGALKGDDSFTPQVSTKDCENAREARAEEARRIAEKLQEGYTLAGDSYWMEYEEPGTSRSDDSVLVDSPEQILANLRRLASYRDSRNKGLRDWYRNLIKRGNNFVVYGSGDDYLVGPSRFVGYVDNSADVHLQVGNRHGGATDQCLKTILGKDWSVGDAREDEIYCDHCDSIGANPKRIMRKFLRLDVPATAAVKASKRTEGGAANSTTLNQDLRILRDRTDLGPTEKKQLIQARRGQGKFRERVCEIWKNSCAVTGSKVTELLRASHIKPWAVSTDEERLDGHNGLLLAPNIDAAFDQGLISFDGRGRLLVSDRLSETEAEKLGIKAGKRIPLCAEQRTFLEHHREAHGFE